MTKIKEYKSGAYTVFEKTGNGYYLVKVYTPGGALHDKILCDDYRNAREYLNVFNKIARNF